MPQNTSFHAVSEKQVIEKLLEKLGLYFEIKIEGRDQLLAVAGSPDWRAGLTRLVQEGRKEGVTFTRTSKTKPTEDELHSLLSYYSFTDEQIRTWFRSIAS
jgi:hypothetical protein